MTTKNKQKKLTIFSGLPASGKSTEIQSLGGAEKFFIINRDDFVYEIGKTFNLSYDETFYIPNPDAKIGDINPVSQNLGKVIEIDAPSWSKSDKMLSYETVHLFREELKKKFTTHIRSAISQDKDIIVDMVMLSETERTSMVENIAIGGLSSEEQSTYDLTGDEALLSKALLKLESSHQTSTKIFMSKPLKKISTMTPEGRTNYINKLLGDPKNFKVHPDLHQLISLSRHREEELKDIGIRKNIHLLAYIYMIERFELPATMPYKVKNVDFDSILASINEKRKFKLGKRKPKTPSV